MTFFGEGVTVRSSFPVGIPENVIITSNSLFLGKFLVLSKEIADLFSSIVYVPSPLFSNLSETPCISCIKKGVRSIKISAFVDL